MEILVQGEEVELETWKKTEILPCTLLYPQSLETEPGTLQWLFGCGRRTQGSHEQKQLPRSKTRVLGRDFQ